MSEKLKYRALVSAWRLSCRLHKALGFPLALLVFPINQILFRAAFKLGDKILRRERAELGIPDGVSLEAVVADLEQRVCALRGDAGVAQSGRADAL